MATNLLAQLAGATEPQTVTVVPQAGQTAQSAVSAIPAVAAQLTKTNDSVEVYVDGPMAAGRSPKDTPLTGMTYSPMGAPVEDKLVIEIDGINADEDSTYILFNAFGTNCITNCGGKSTDDNAIVQGKKSASGCDPLAVFIAKLKAGFSYDIKNLKFEDITPNATNHDLDYEIEVRVANGSRYSSTNSFNPADSRDNKAFLQSFVFASLTNGMQRIDGDTAWFLPVKKGKKARMTLNFAKRYQNV